MFRIQKAARVAENIFEIWVRAPHVARNAKAGQFVVIRVDERGERIPLTISAVEQDSVRLIFQVVGKTTEQLSRLVEGDEIRDVAGPLGRPSAIERYGTVAVVGGGVGVAGAPMIAKAAMEAGNHVIGIIGARSRGFLILRNEMEGCCHELHVATDDGSYGAHGFVTDILKGELNRREIDCIWAIGPTIMMKAVASLTRPYGVRTFVSLNPIMVDGTGMCGSCRVTVGGETRFACVDGPEFDAHRVDFDELMTRLRTYHREEKEALLLFRECAAREGGR
ncbi:MAG: sulfide/dihydroorotate dehydrogenase-like FAD/NAD-binding protein [Methanomicrobiales archaeon]|nr:sulfide/dihydroorotate dehydrogenase-like FAD/NAD-binding protein [Methanomicrobiales archaeon]